MNGLRVAASSLRLPASSRQMRSDPGPVGIGKDIGVAPGEADIGQGLAERVGHLGQDELLLAVRAEQDDGRQRDGFGGQDVAPRIMGLLFDGGVDGALEGKIMRERG